MCGRKLGKHFCNTFIRVRHEIDVTHDLKVSYGSKIEEIYNRILRRSQDGKTNKTKTESNTLCTLSLTELSPNLLRMVELGYAMLQCL